MARRHVSIVLYHSGTSELGCLVFAHPRCQGYRIFQSHIRRPRANKRHSCDPYYQTVQPGQTVSIYTQVDRTDALITQLAPVLNSPTALGYV